MKKTILVIALIFAFAFTQEKTYHLKFTESEADKIIQAVSVSEVISAKDASLIIQKIEAQAADTTLNKK